MRTSHARILSGSGSGRCLDLIQLNRLEQALREWAGSPRRPDFALPRRRVLLIFLLIRYTGARLSEVLGLDLKADFRLRNAYGKVSQRRSRCPAPARRVG